MSSTIPEFGDFSAQEIQQRVQQAGIVGAGGAGFPTHIKLKAQAEIYLVNAAECEPLLQVDQQIIVQEADKLIRGLQYGMKATGATEGIIAIKGKHQNAIALLQTLLPKGIRLYILPDVYPAGDEVITIWLATGRVVPPAALPLSVGVVVNNVQTLINVAKAVESQTPVTHRTLTVNGAVNKPITVTLPIGTSLREVLALAGGATVARPAFINGGPMMGALLPSLDLPVTKTTGGLLVLPDDHILIERRQYSSRTLLTQAHTVCEQCRMCTEFCPRHIVGHELPPHLIVRSVSYFHLENPSSLLSALTCSECAVCEAWSCPVDISPMQINRMLKKKLREAGLRYQGELRHVDPMAEYRLVPIKRLVERLGLTAYMKHKAPLIDVDWQPQRVEIALNQHIGALAKPLVTVGESVSEQQCIAQVDEGALGAAIHASISGTVEAINQNSITIVRK